MRLLVLLCLLSGPALGATRDVFDRVRHGYANDDGVRIHYASLGRRGPLIVMIHGFPDFWYTWRDQMAALARGHRVVAIDQRGYDLSDHPAGDEPYAFPHLLSDVAAVIHAVGEEKAVIVGHDWGGVVAWLFAILHPEMTERLIVLNMPHPRGLFRELRENPAQRAASEYARVFQSGAADGIAPESLVGWVKDADARARYVEAMRRSDIHAMLAYYKENYPRDPYPDIALPTVQAPVLVIYGLRDPYLLAAGLDRTWEWLAQDFTLVTIPDAGHFVQQDASATVTATMVDWLAGRKRRTR